MLNVKLSKYLPYVIPFLCKHNIELSQNRHILHLQPTITGKHTATIDSNSVEFQVGALLSFEDEFLKAVTKAHYVLPVDSINQMSIAIADLMSRQFKAEVLGVIAGSTSSGNVHKPKVPDLKEITKVGVAAIEIMKNVGTITYESAVKEGSGARPPRMWEVSGPEAEIPNAPTNFTPQQRQLGHLHGAALELNQYYASLVSNSSLKDSMVQAETMWLEAEKNLSKIIDDMTSTFEDVVFPVSMYTRRKAHLHGSSLHLGGLIKAVITDFNYKKFFSAKLAGGKRAYCVSIALDVSLSMNGHFAQCAVDTLVCLIASLRRIGVENFSLVLFGENVRYEFVPHSIWPSYFGKIKQ